MKGKFGSVLLFILVTGVLYAKNDTVVNNRHYNYVDYYPNGKIKSLGNKSDTLKTGKWIYYKNDGTVLANGKYKKGYKIGKWIYNGYNNKIYEKHWSRNNQPFEEVYLKDGKLYISDFVTNGMCHYSWCNGGENWQVADW